MSIAFNGVNQYLRRTTGNPSTPIQVFPFTVCAWAYPFSTSTGDAVVGFGIDGTRTNFSINTSGTQARWALQSVRSDTGAAVTLPTSAINTIVANQWQFVCGTVNGSYTTGTAWQIENWSLTVNTTTRKQTIATPIIQGVSYNRCSIGGWFRNTASLYFEGYIAEVAGWNVVLSDAEILSLAKSVKPPMIRPESLVMYFPGIRETDQELVRGLTFTNINSVGATADHPRRYG